MESPVDVLPEPVQLRTNSGDIIRGSDTGLALEAHRDSDWRGHSLKTECSVVIGARKDSSLPGDVKTTNLSFD